jgi:hypothetical protein
MIYNLLKDKVRYQMGANSVFPNYSGINYLSKKIGSLLKKLNHCYYTIYYVTIFSNVFVADKQS